MKERHIVIGVTGSIAAYKAAELVRLFVKKGWKVTVVMTRAAEHFVGELTFRTLSQGKVYTDMFAGCDEWCPEHISIADRCDVFLIAPCTANVIAKLAHGLADDILTAAALATSSPLVVAPAMNEKMWNNPATIENVRILVDRGIEVLETGNGALACGCEGAGRLVSLDVIVDAIENKFK